MSDREQILMALEDAQQALASALDDIKHYAEHECLPTEDEIREITSAEFNANKALKSFATPAPKASEFPDAEFEKWTGERHDPICSMCLEDGAKWGFEKGRASRGPEGSGEATVLIEALTEIIRLSEVRHSGIQSGEIAREALRVFCFENPSVTARPMGDVDILIEALKAECPCINNYPDGKCRCGIQETLSTYEATLKGATDAEG